MLDISLHKTKMLGILHSIYTDPILRKALGFKGGTAALLFYELPRFSVDLDFDLLDEVDTQLIMEKVESILSRFGTLQEATEKRYTLFFLLNYEKGTRGLKVEISKRISHAKFEVKNYMGISMLVMEQSHMTASKLVALITRKSFAARDVFDIWYFLKSGISINEDQLLNVSNMSLTEALSRAITQVHSLKSNNILTGLGELLDPKQKAWCKANLIQETLLYLNMYLELVQSSAKSK